MSLSITTLLACIALLFSVSLHAAPEVHVAIPPSPEVVNLVALHHAIALRETGNRNMVGRRGEHGPMQTTRAARKYGSDMDYLIRLFWLIDDPTPYRLALAWHAGPTGMQHPTARQQRHAQDVANLYFESQQKAQDRCLGAADRTTLGLQGG